MTPSTSAIVSQASAARRLKVSRTQVARLIAAKRLDVVMVDTRPHVTLRSLDRLLASRTAR